MYMIGQIRMRMICVYLRLPRAFVIKEVTHDGAISVAGQDAFTRNTDTEPTNNNENMI